MVCTQKVVREEFTRKEESACEDTGRAAHGRARTLEAGLPISHQVQWVKSVRHHRKTFQKNSVMEDELVPVKVLSGKAASTSQARASRVGIAAWSRSGQTISTKTDERAR